jgi:hemoglobin-like flavoprotein
MTPSQRCLVQSTFDRILPIADDAAALFYSRLFHLDPSLRPMFIGDLRQQGNKLMNMLAIAVRNLERFDLIEPAVIGLGKRHVAYGVREHHYETAARALMWTLEQGLGDEWSDDVRDAWSAAYARIAGLMKSVAVEPELIMA